MSTFSWSVYKHVSLSHLTPIDSDCSEMYIDSACHGDKSVIAQTSADWCTIRYEVVESERLSISICLVMVMNMVTMLRSVHCDYRCRKVYSPDKPTDKIVK